MIIKFKQFINESITEQDILKDMMTRVDEEKFNQYLLEYDINKSELNENELLNKFENFIDNEYQLRVNKNGLISFWKLDDDVEELIKNNAIQLYHFSSSKLKKSILENGLQIGIKKTNPYKNSYSGIYLTTETSGNVIDGYKKIAVSKHRGIPIMVTVKTYLKDIEPDFDDEDLSSGETQFIIDGVSPENIIDIEETY